MRIFVTGGTGFIGTHLVPELLAAGHHVIGLTRSDAGAEALAAAGAEPWRGTIEDSDGLRAAAAAADAVIHTAFDHDFSNFVANCEKDRRVIEALSGALKGSDRPLLITSGTGMGGGKPCDPATEDRLDRDHPNPRILSELAGEAMLDAGVNISVVRLPQVHDRAKQGLISPYIALCREKGVAAYIGDGGHRWPAAAVGDVAKLYRLAIERAEPGARYHAVAEEGIAFRDIARAVSVGLGIAVRSVSPQEAEEHFGWLAMFAGLDMPASSALTRAKLGWEPTGPGLIEDLERMDYGAAGAAH